MDQKFQTILEVSEKLHCKYFINSHTIATVRYRIGFNRCKGVAKSNLLYIVLLFRTKTGLPLTDLASTEVIQFDAEGSREERGVIHGKNDLIMGRVKKDENNWKERQSRSFQLISSFFTLPIIKYIFF